MSDQTDPLVPRRSDAYLAFECLKLAAACTMPGIGPLPAGDVVERAQAYFDFVQRGGKR